MKPKSRFADRVLLALTAIVLTCAAWAMLHYLGDSYFSVASTILVVVLFAENWRLHKLLREHGIESKRKLDKR